MSPGPAKGLRVLFVEDAFDQALLVKAFLSAAGGFEVTHSQDGDHAVQLIHDQDWDLVITDLNLPGTDGFEVIRAARAKSADLPILATTGYTGTEYLDQAVRSGANDVLTKPLDKDSFLLQVATLTGSGQAEESAGPSSAILAIGGLAGDVEMGCGGSLMLAAAEGHVVVVIPVCRDELDTEGVALKATKEATKLMGLRVEVVESALDDTGRRVALIEKAISDLRPSVVYIPALDDSHPSRMEAFRVAQAVTSSIETVYSYQTATTGLDFRPTRFVDIADQMILKMEALATFVGAGRLDLTPRMAQAYSRYWGRYQRFTEVEAFEVIKGKV